VFINKSYCDVFIIFGGYLFTYIFHSRIPVSPLIPYSINFVQRGSPNEERIPRVVRGLTVGTFTWNFVHCDLNLNSVNQLIFIMVKYGVLFEVRAGFLNNI
jgi:hypothetical protein